MFYKRYLKSLLFSFLISWIVFVIAALYQIGAPTVTSRTFYELDTIKSTFAKSIKTPKVLIVSGSNSLFGISSQMITQETGIPAVNTSIQAGFGINYMLYRTRELAKNGDIVLLPLEYELYMSGALPSNVVVDYVFAHDSKYLLTHPWFIALLSFERLALGISTKIHSSPIESAYQSRIINLSGDITTNQETNITVNDRKKLDATTPFKIKEFTYSSFELRSIKQFSDWCYSNKIKLITTWPSTIWFESYKQPNYQGFFQNIKNFYNSINVPVIGNYRDFMYDKSMFYDTVYHLNDRGRRYRTRQLIKLLQPYLSEMIDRAYNV